MPARLQLASLVLLALACNRPPSAPEAQPEPDVVLFGAEMHMYRGADLTLVGRAAQVTYHRTSADVTATETQLRFPPRHGGRRPGTPASGIEVLAPKVGGNLYTRQADGSGGVAIRAPSGMVGHTPTAHFDGAEMKMDGAEPVQVQGPGYTMSAEGFTLMFDDEDFQFKGPTRTELVPAAEGGGR